MLRPRCPQQQPAWGARGAGSTLHSFAARWQPPHHSTDVPRRDQWPATPAGSPLAGGSTPQSTEAGHAKVGRMAKLLQNVNLAGTSLFLQILRGDQALALPHVSVPDIAWVDWAALRAAGFRACVFDKDNTLCEPFALAVAPALLPSFASCQAAFGPGRVALYSNSAGLEQYDPQGREAAALEAAFGVCVLRHRDKKPAGGCEELRRQLGCEPHEMIFVGDRYLTDVVFGNRHGMLTVRVAPLTSRGEPPGVLAARAVEEACVRRWTAAGIKAPAHALLPHDRAARVAVAPPAEGAEGAAAQQRKQQRKGDEQQQEVKHER